MTRSPCIAEASAPKSLVCRQAGGAQSPCQAVFGDGGGDDVRDLDEGRAVVSDADADRCRFHGLDVVVGVAKRDGMRERNAHVLADGADADCFRQMRGNDLEGDVACGAYGADDRAIAVR